MALTDENGGNFVATMPMAPAYGGGYGNGGFGGFGNDWGWIILLLLAFNGGWGNGFGGCFGGGDLYPWLNNSQNINGGFRDQMLNSQIGDIQNAITSGFGNVATQLCGGFAGVNANITNAQMANMNQMFGVQSALQNCCCENRAGIADLKYTVATENCADRYEAAQNTQSVLTAISGGIQSIKDQLCSDKIEAKNDLIAQLRSELMFARGQASQDVQTAAIQAGQRALANEVEQYVLPTPRPAYIVANPNCCTQNTCGCGGF